jgi:hypothetical protein
MSEIKQTKELFEGLKLVAVAAKKIAKDGKVDLSDVGAVIDLAKESSVLIEAVKDLDQVPTELKDLEKEELLELILTVYKAVDEIEKI